ncbi:hypothetical protein B7R87_11785 [Streptomyces tsukubensis]|uniref:Uncharacterized protein n=1 Tax=Streptomyces tsukubensis (strain DSM 42081 / NBRC 108919 / NRRL 18488 / 9993) TaxID=1114943 RepID=I2MZM5_STRT9|nr:hypothetical protein B7R87_11785 [Streptomyces tsukubensis]EIF90222.1 hypothetical protein [Streptomyces tsukubensis NRRL18488]QKM69447.1 hypothetical protein STSU_021990 [Streptomyces tsukubensis NRRL18488]TAI42623.1 hypothetical protein EWI31_19540 [Streptomyces tsukubensis]
MTRDALLSQAPEPFGARCVHCGNETCIPVAVGSVERASGPPVVYYACPPCALKHGAGPTPDEELDP